jgi:ubiquinone/menaquinone biosynthesis C-methylase UbiE
MYKRDLASEIKKANREVYNTITPEKYNLNESIFNEERKKACGAILDKAIQNSGNGRFLDIGTGTGNLLRLACDRFKVCTGCDISEKLLAKVQADFPKANLLASDAESLPFSGSTFNCVSCYALLHHLLNHEKLFKECYRILEEGGTLYTDHDPNYYFNRFYHVYYKIRFSGKHGFSSATEDLAEYHNVYSSGIDPEYLRKLLLEIGFKKVEVIYRITDNRNMGLIKNCFLSFLRLAVKFIPLKSFHTHFAIIAVK